MDIETGKMAAEFARVVLNWPTLIFGLCFWLRKEIKAILNIFIEKLPLARKVKVGPAEMEVDLLRTDSKELSENMLKLSSKSDDPELIDAATKAVRVADTVERVEQALALPLTTVPRSALEKFPDSQPLRRERYRFISSLLKQSGLHDQLQTQASEAELRIRANMAIKGVTSGAYCEGDWMPSMVLVAMKSPQIVDDNLSLTAYGLKWLRDVFEYEQFSDEVKRTSRGWSKEIP